MISVPHPFTQDYAEKWIASHGDAYARGEAVHFSICLLESGTLVGAVGTQVHQCRAQPCRNELLDRS